MNNFRRQLLGEMVDGGGDRSRYPFGCAKSALDEMHDSPEDY